MGQTRQDPLLPPFTRRAAHDQGLRRDDAEGALFRLRYDVTGEPDQYLDPAPVYRNVVRKYGLATGISAEVNGLCVHSMRVTAASNALENDADIEQRASMTGASASRRIAPTFRVGNSPFEYR